MVMQEFQHDANECKQLLITLDLWSLIFEA
jgi:hypothetical protein